MQFEIAGILFMFAITFVLSIPFGRYLAGVLQPTDGMGNTLADRIDRLIYRIAGVNPKEEMSWKTHLKVLLLINALWFTLSMVVLTQMGNLPLNPDGNPSMTPDLAFNTAISFVCNTNLQHYSGEGGISYLGQLVLMLWQFLSAATGLAVAAILFQALKPGSNTKLGNSYVYLIRSITRVLFPMSLLIAGILLLNGVPMTFEGKATMVTLEGDTIQVSKGPVAAFTAIKHLGTNGGGFFGANSAHPFENTNYLTNVTEMVAQMILPFALVFALGYALNRRRLSWVIFGVMTTGFLLLVIPTLLAEANGNPEFTRMGLSAQGGNMEGKEVRFGTQASAYWSIATTVISTGSVNAMHDSFMPISGMNQLLGMMVNACYGGVGVGLLNFYIYIILAVFISGLMVGRTPEFMGKKVEAREMKIAMITALLHPLLILSGTALACWAYISYPQACSGWLANPGKHGFTEMLYEFTSSAANNGSGYEGLGDNTLFWNITCGVVMLLGRFLPIVGPIAIAGLLANKKYIPEGGGTLKTDTITFGIMVFAVMLIIAALSFFPALTLGPIAEYFNMVHKPL